MRTWSLRQEVRDKLLKQTFTTGARIVYKHGGVLRADGTFVPPFSVGTVMGPSSPNNAGYVNVEFDGNNPCGGQRDHIAVAKIKLQHAQELSPQVAAPHWWLCPGMPVKYVGKSGTFKNKGGSVSHGQVGFILGLHTTDMKRVQVWMPNIANAGIYTHDLALPPGDGSMRRALTLSVSPNKSLPQKGAPLCE